MGVSGLWTLLEPVGKRVNIKSLAGKTLAPVSKPLQGRCDSDKAPCADASIWIYQFFNSMRDDDGNFIKNGHLLGFFRRICRLMFNRIRPVFVFDGATPTLKRMTVAARRRRREQQAASVRKTAEKLLMAKLKKHVLAEEKAQRAAEKALKKQAAEEDRAKKRQGTKRKRGQQGVEPADVMTSTVEKNPSMDRSKPIGTGNGGASTSRSGAQGAVSDAQAPNASEAQQLAAAAELLEDDVGLADPVAELQHDTDPADVAELSDVESEESAGEIDLDAMVGEGGELDPAALSQLPTSLQIELMGKYRERQAMLNRSRFHENSTNAQAFSGLQMATYLKQTELRRKVDKLKDDEAAQGEQRVNVQADSVFVLKDHSTGGDKGEAKEAPRTNGRNVTEWNRRMLYDAKRMIHDEAPALSLTAVAPDLPAMCTQELRMVLDAAAAAKIAKSKPSAPGQAATGSEFDFSDDPGPSAATTTAEVQAITAEELALAMQSGTPSASGSDGCEWEDAFELSPDTGVPAANDSDKAAPQATRRDVWTRTHGYKFGRKLADWTDSIEQAPAGVNAADAAAIETVVATADQGEASHSVQEARKLQLAILQSFDGQGYLEAEEPRSDPQLQYEEAPVHCSQGRGRERVHFAIEEPQEHNLQGNSEQTKNDQAPAVNHAEVGGVDADSAEARRDSSRTGHVAEADPVMNPSLAKSGQAVTNARSSLPVQESEASEAPMPSSNPPREQADPIPDSSEALKGGPEALVLDIGGSQPSTDTQAAGPRIKLPSLKAVKQSQAKSTPKPIMNAGSAGDSEFRPLEQGAISNEAALAEKDEAGKGVDVCDLEWQEVNNVGMAAASHVPDAETHLIPQEPAQKRQALQVQHQQKEAAQAVPATRSAPASKTAPVCVPVQGDGSSKPLQHDTLQTIDVYSNAMDHSVHNYRSSEPESWQSIRHNTADDGEAAPVSPGQEPANAGIYSRVPTAPRAESGASLQDPAGSVDIDYAHAAAMELEQAEEELEQDEDDAVVHLVETPEAAGGAEDAMPAGGGTAADVPQDAPQASADYGEGGRQQAGMQELPGNEADHIINADDLEKKIAEVMGDVNKLKGRFKKQSGTEEVPAEMMYREVQELLQLFGIPYIVAPMEAEAQCAWLNSAGLVDGVITDDNDVFLFGASHVYRHFFQEQMYCEQYLASSLEQELALTRERLALLALLLGSDYTEGISGIGIVNAMETIATFPSIDDLKVFKQWIETPDIEAFRAVTKGSKKKRKVGASEEDQGEDAPVTAVDKYKLAHQAARKAWDVPANFPEQKVLDEYANPRVDTNKSSFTFHKPDIDILRGYCLRQFNWDQDQADALLQPVLKQYEEKEKQLRLDAFWTVTHRFAKIRSKRLQAAISTSLGRDLPQEMLMTAVDHPPVAAPPKKAGAGAKNSRKSHQEQSKRGSKSGSAGKQAAPAKKRGDKQMPAQDSDDVEQEEEEEEEDDDDNDDEHPADQPRYDLPPGDPDDFGGLDMGMDSYRAQFFY